MALDSRVAALCALALLAVPGAAAAGPPGTWTQVTNPPDEGSSTDQIGVSRSGNGRLNVLWTTDTSIINSQVSADARTVTGPHTVFTYGVGAGSVALLTSPDGSLRAFFTGIEGNASSAHEGVVSTATSADGVSWAVQPTGASDSTPEGSFSKGELGGTFFANGTPMSIWSDQYRGYHVGTSDQTPDVAFGPDRTATVSSPDAATDGATGQVAIGWNDGDVGRTAAAFVQPTTSPWFPPGTTMYAPSGQAPDAASQVGMSGRSAGAGGIFLAYLRGTNPFSSRPAVWRIGSNSAIPLTNKQGGRFPGVEAGPGGRLWAFWGERPAAAWQIHVRRSNPAATTFGGTAVIKPPAGTTGLWGLKGAGNAAGSCDTLDLLAHVTRGDTTANYQTRVRPGITLKKKILNKRRGKKQKVRFTTLDAGVPVNVRVKFGKIRKATGADGKVKIKIKRKRRTRRVKARASGACYENATLRVKVRKKRRPR